MDELSEPIDRLSTHSSNLLTISHVTIYQTIPKLDFMQAKRLPNLFLKRRAVLNLLEVQRESRLHIVGSYVLPQQKFDPLKGKVRKNVTEQASNRW